MNEHLYSYKNEEPKQLPLRFRIDSGQTRTSLHKLSKDELKSLGFQYATKAGISLGIDDLKIPPKLFTYESNKSELFVPHADDPVSTITAGCPCKCSMAINIVSRHG